MQWPIIRDIILFFSGLGGIGFLLATSNPDPIFLAIFAGMIGLPIPLRADRKNGNGNGSS